VLQVPLPVQCISHMVYDIDTDKVYLMGTTDDGVEPERLWFVTIDPQTNSVARVVQLKTNDKTGKQVLHPFNSLATIDATRGTFITIFCCSPFVKEERLFVNISMATGEITGFTAGGSGILQNRYFDNTFYAYAFDKLVTIDLRGSGQITRLLDLPNHAFDAEDQLMGAWSPIVSDSVSFVQLWHNSPDRYFVTIVKNYNSFTVLPVAANRFTFAPQGNAPFPWKPTFFFEGQYQPAGI